ncbi:MAG: hypothetical protein FJ248_07475 [Nitrospira sp.]|nr:hypothetical protein [Nitrospira sp.]
MMPTDKHRGGPPQRPAVIVAGLMTALLTLAGAWTLIGTPAQASTEQVRPYLSRARIFLSAGDYRRALEAAQKVVDESPSAESYIYLTYVYQAIDGYLEYLASTEQWGAVDRVYINLAFRNPEDLVDPPGGLARMAKEMIQTSVRQQSDLSAAMAIKLDKALAERLWQQQAAWRTAHPDRWWTSTPESWNW